MQHPIQSGSEQKHNISLEEGSWYQKQSKGNRCGNIELRQKGKNTMKTLNSGVYTYICCMCRINNIRCTQKKQRFIIFN